MVGREAVRWHTIEQLTGWLLGKVSDGRTRLVAQAVRTALLLIRDVVLEEVVVIRVLHQRPGQREHWLERPQVAPLLPVFTPAFVLDAASELDDQVAALGVGVLEWELPLRETLAEALRCLVVVASS